VEATLGSTSCSGTGTFDPVNQMGPRPALLSRPDMEFLGYPDFTDSLYGRPTRVPSAGSAVILPVRKKTFDDYPDFWKRLWRRASVALDQSDRITRIGYSLPGADEKARKLLLNCPNKQALVTICCGSSTERWQVASEEPNSQISSRERLRSRDGSRRSNVPARPHGRLLADE
jgi:hypothetical protein